MKTITKQFDQKLNDDYGDPAEVAVINWLKTRRAVQDVIRHPYGRKDVDLLIITDVGNLFYADVERRKNWKRGRWPFETLHIPIRKRKFVEGRIPFLYYAVRNDLKMMVKVAGRDIRRSLIVENGNRFVENGERFYSINAIKLVHVSLNGG